MILAIRYLGTWACLLLVADPHVDAVQDGDVIGRAGAGLVLSRTTGDALTYLSRRAARPPADVALETSRVAVPMHKGHMTNSPLRIAQFW
jgi:hypothetical protein